MDTGYNQYCPDHDISALSNWWSRAIFETTTKYTESINAKRWENGATTSFYHDSPKKWSIENYSSLMSNEDWNNPQNISNTIYPKYGNDESGDILTNRSVINTDGRTILGEFYISWSDLYPFWQEIGYARFDPRKGEKCPR